MNESNQEAERRAVKHRLDEDLNEISFRGHDEVLKRAFRPSRRQRLSAWWNKDVEFSLGPVSAAFALLLLITAVGLPIYEASTRFSPEERYDRSIQLIETRSGIYDKAFYERMVNKHEN
ncbi:hypothetical protein [Saccharibacillus alkalitolerans]|uniref:Uncharacterized protein n=1 Tax=Saccharibacillus alkalitolerans TaxID=2705290 RepID=A0ABX0F338_9BACL|nr:hypothetical protein [Saccharibacillus alkalitolerans]NGZ74359.1 hypothetical protein [Saccharibacillus alkalitolerans]